MSLERDYLEVLERSERRGVDELARHALALGRLLEISRDLASLDPGQVLARILDHVRELTGTRRGAVLLGERLEHLEVEIAHGLDPAELPPAGFGLSRSVVERSLSHGEVVLIEDVPASPQGSHASLLALGLCAVLAVPLRTRERTLGVIYLDTDSSEHHVERADLPLLAAFGLQAAVALDNAHSYRRLEEDNYFLRRSVAETLRFDRILYRSRSMHRLCETIRRVGASELTVLIHGETGTGKELVARALHGVSRRRDRPFLSFNAGALPEALLESELFGHRRGAFSGALEHKIGLFEAAQGGTVLLDEIGEASPALQVRLLRLLEEGSLRRVGETQDRRVDVRVLAATHRDLEAEVAAGRFRQDLLYRLSVFPLEVPPLRERREDIEPLARHFVEEACRELGRPPLEVGPRALAELAARPWPGNVRELRNALQRLVVLSPRDFLILPSEIDAPPLEPAVPLHRGEAAGFVPLSLSELEREHIRCTLEHTGGNQSEASRLLGLPRGTLRWRMAKLGL
ncbi:MAG: sigma 54-interacting transcriptional regulator [Thermoanaerobaculia bacterium]